jgi:hypothetical protein
MHCNLEFAEADVGVNWADGLPVTDRAEQRRAPNIPPAGHCEPLFSPQKRAGANRKPLQKMSATAFGSCDPRSRYI